MRTISLKLPEHLLARLERESRARRTTKSSLVRECLEKELPARPVLARLPKLPPGESVYDKALPLLKRAWARRGRGARNLATNPRYLDYDLPAMDARQIANLLPEEFNHWKQRAKLDGDAKTKADR